MALAGAAPAAEEPAPAIANPGFEEGQAGQPPPHWFTGVAGATAPPGTPQPAYRTVIDRDDPQSGTASARLERIPGAEGQSAFGSFSQTIDATPFRGRRIRLTASARADAAITGALGLWLRVDRPGGILGFFDNMQDRPITGTDWADYSIEGLVAPDAERVVFGSLLVGTGRGWADDFRLEIVETAAGQAVPAAELTQYLDRALAFLRLHHINSASADWARIDESARAAVVGATQFDQVHGAIRGAIDALGERHTFLRPPAPVPAQATAAPAADPPRMTMPEHKRVGDRIGLVRIPAFLGNPAEARHYTATLRQSLGELDQAGVCGWIVDLRTNSGGNMWPMLAGLDPLLGPAPFGQFRTPAGATSYWTRTDTGMMPAQAATVLPPAFALEAAEAPVAVLFGPGTASSGEMVAIAFAGRARTRSFGMDSAGFATANVAFPLSDGATLVITTAFVSDRTGKQYAGALVADERVPTEEAEAAAVRWLETQGSC